jgi:phosphoesterase RecJ-like protein
MIYRIAVAAKVEITPSMATCLYTAILSDTGSFTYPSTNAETFALAYDLAARGANPSQIARDLYFSNPASKIRLLGTALSNLQCDGPLAWSWVTSHDMDQAGAGAEDCEGVVNYLISIAGIESAVFLRELPSADQFRLSIRSKGKVDVAQIAEGFGGGGHRSASGCTLDGPLTEATDRILAQLRTGLC